MTTQAHSFSTIRQWDGSQDRAFEELSYQLLRGTVPAGARAIRTGNPDGGVEWYATLEDGTQIGWQAKYVSSIDTLISGMTSSVKRVTAERPLLRKLVFVVSMNLSGGTAGGRQRSGHERYEAQVSRWREEIPGAEQLEFELVQSSDLLALLSQPEHAGRKWFWWGETVLTADWLREKLEQQAQAAGRKYRPELQVDLPIQRDLTAAAFGEAAYRHLTRLLRDVSDAEAELLLRTERDEPQPQLYDAIRATAEVLAEHAKASGVEARDRNEVRLKLLTVAEQCRHAISQAQMVEFDRMRAREKSAGQSNVAVPGTMDVATGPYVTSLGKAIERLLAWLETAEGRALSRPFYLLTGAAGSGKTHLLLDATARALDEGRPALFLASAPFGGALWGSITEQLGLSDIGGDVLLDAMDSAGEATSLTGRRFLIIIDALNETTTDEFWVTHLPQLRAAVQSRPHVALVVSCRDTYVELVADEEERAQYVSRAHPGFAGREEEAAAKYFAHYKLEAPRFPLLTPEFTHPLFLGMFCEGMSEESGDTSGTWHSRTRIFERFLTAKIRHVARRAYPRLASGFEFEQAQQDVRAVLDALIGRLADTGKEFLAVSDALSVVANTLECTRRAATRMLGILQDEGVLTRERAFLPGQNRVEAVRVVFQAFSDFLILRHRLPAVPTSPLDDAFRAWLTENASLGVLDAAAIALPERSGEELTDVMKIDILDLNRQHRASRGAGRRLLRQETGAVAAFIRSLPRRSSSSISERTIELFNDASGFQNPKSRFRTLFLVAPQPHNLMNAERLHTHLAAIPMPRRDSYFGFATSGEIFDEDSPATRLARWASRGPYPAYDPQVIELAAIPLCWLLNTPGRHQRDWVTKALTQLLRGHLDVATKLIQRFRDVDDPYISSRVMLIAYGALLQAPHESPHVRLLVDLVRASAFTPSAPTNEQFLDAARSIIRFAVDTRILPEEAITESQPPYGFAEPRTNVPTEAALEARYGAWKDVPEDENWRSIYSSIFSMGDFGRYVVEYAAEQFSRTPLGQEHPPKVAQTPRPLDKDALEKFLASLTREQRDSLPPASELTALDLFRLPRQLSLSAEQSGLLIRVHSRRRQRAARRVSRERMAKRWVMTRTVSLGWTPELFAEEDRGIGYSNSGRRAHKSERWGKKYQWLALYEYIARMADHYRLKDEQWHVRNGSRDIDPTLTPVEYEEFVRDDDAAPESTARVHAHALKALPTPALDFSRYHDDINAFVADEDSEPTIEELTSTHAHDGSRWITLGGNLSQIDPHAIRGWAGLRQTAYLHSWIVPRGEGTRMVHTLAEVGDPDRLELPHGGGHADCCYLHELGRTDTGCAHRYPALRAYTRGSEVFHAAPTVESYTWSGRGLDCSMEEDVSILLPSSFIQAHNSLSFTEETSTWQDAAGLTAYRHQTHPEEPAHGLIVRDGHLAALLESSEMELVFWGWMERMNMESSPRPRRAQEKWSRVRYTAWMDSSLAPRDARIQRRGGLITRNN